MPGRIRRLRLAFWLRVADVLEPYSERLWLWAICRASDATDWGSADAEPEEAHR